MTTFPQKIQVALKRLADAEAPYTQYTSMKASATSINQLWANNIITQNQKERLWRRLETRIRHKVEAQKAEL